MIFSIEGDIAIKTPEELNALKNEVETLNKKLAELTNDELKQVAGGNAFTECLSSVWDWLTDSDKSDGKGKIGNGNPNMGEPLR